MGSIGKQSRTGELDAAPAGGPTVAATPGKTTLTEALPAGGAVVQRQAEGPTPGPTGGHGAAPAEGHGATPAPAAPATPPRELAATERVLSRDPTYAADGYLPWFRAQLKAKLEAWALTFSDASVSLATVKLDGAGVKAVVLAWDASWGALPLTRDFPLSLGPVDARAAVTAVHALPGWAKVPAGDHGTIDGVLGGELNALSAASREHLRPTYKALKAKTADEQAAALKGTMTVQTAMPGWTAEPMATAVATVTLAGPTEKKDYEFTGKKADAEEWVATYSDGVKLKLVAPKAPTAGYHNHTVQEAATAAGYMPKAARSVITLIMLNPVVNPKDADWAVEYHRANFHSYMTASVAGVVTIYPDKTTNALPGDDGRRSAMVHETGHTWSYKAWGTDKTKGKWVDWKTAMDADKAAVSGYATAAIAEDVAETIRVYVSSKGTPRYAEYDKIVPHRFKILAAEYDK